MPAKYTLHAFRNLCEQRTTAAYHSIQKETEKLLADPLHTLSWGMQLFSAAADRAVWLEALQTVQHAINSDSDEADAAPIIAALQQNALRNILQAARSPARSSSPTSNLAEQERSAAYARMLDAHPFEALL